MKTLKKKHQHYSFSSLDALTSVLEIFPDSHIHTEVAAFEQAVGRLAKLEQSLAKISPHSDDAFSIFVAYQPHEDSRALSCDWSTIAEDFSNAYSSIRDDERKPRIKREAL